MDTVGDPPATDPQRSFLRSALRDMRTVGAIVPSGRALARALVEPVLERDGEVLRVLEAGAGTGAVTGHILRHLAPGSRLVVAEPRPEFQTRLRQVCALRPDVDVRIHPATVETLTEPASGFDVIVSGLPFANFTHVQVHDILTRFATLLAPGGSLTWFAYRGASVRRALSMPGDRQRQRKVHAVMTALRESGAGGRQVIWRNLPPAVVHLVRSHAEPGERADS